MPIKITHARARKHTAALLPTTHRARRLGRLRLGLAAEQLRVSLGLGVRDRLVLGRQGDGPCAVAVAGAGAYAGAALSRGTLRARRGCLFRTGGGGRGGAVVRSCRSMCLCEFS